VRGRVVWSKGRRETYSAVKEVSEKGNCLKPPGGGRSYWRFRLLEQILEITVKAEGKVNVYPRNDSRSRGKS